MIRRSNFVFWSLVGFAAALVFAVFAIPAKAGHCHVQRVVSYAYPVVQPIYYSVGESARFEVVVEKKLQEREKQWRSLNSGQPVAPAAPDGSPQLLIKQYCGKCHGGATPDGGFRLDGTDAIDSDLVTEFKSMTKGLRAVPTKMKPLLETLTPEGVDALETEMLKLRTAKPKPKPADDDAGILK